MKLHYYTILRWLWDKQISIKVYIYYLFLTVDEMFLIIITITMFLPLLFFLLLFIFPSIGLEPLYPQLCARHPRPRSHWSSDSPSPSQLASNLLALPCSLSFQRDDNVRLVQLIMEVSVSQCSLCLYEQINYWNMNNLFCKSFIKTLILFVSY